MDMIKKMFGPDAALMRIVGGQLVADYGDVNYAVAAKSTVGKDYFVDTNSGSDLVNDGKSWIAPFKTMGKAFEVVANNDVVHFIGNVREQLTAPLGVTGVVIMGAMGGRTRHDGGARWYSPAAPTALTPLLTLREQGWELRNFLFVPPTDAAAVRCHRAETAAYPDSSHFIMSGMKFVGAKGGTGEIAVEDWGGNHHYLIEDCEFMSCDKAICAPAGSPGIAAPLRNVIRFNVFENNGDDIEMDASRCLILGNVFMTAGGGGHNVVNLAYTSDVSGANFVIGNFFKNAQADISVANGYKASTNDVWRNYSTDTAAMTVTNPA